MYAVFQNGGKQYRVKEGDFLKLEKLNVKVGTFIDFNDILMISDGTNTKIGTPIINESKIKAEIISHGRNQKLKILKFRRRKHSRKLQGHRQYFTNIKIVKIY